MGVPHFFSTFLACLYHRYLSLKIEQLLEVFDGIEQDSRDIDAADDGIIVQPVTNEDIRG